MSPIKIIDPAERKDVYPGIYPLAAAFYTAYGFGQEEGFPVPEDLNAAEQDRYLEARQRVCQAIRENQPINGHDGGDDAVVLMLGRIPDNHGSGQQFSQLLEEAAIRGQLSAFYEQNNQA